MGQKLPAFSAEAIDLLLHYSWPGNIRELENVVHFALLVAGTNIIDASHLKVTGGWNTGATRSTSIPLHNINRQPLEKPLSSQAYSTGTISQDDPLAIIAQQLRRLFTDYGDGAHFEKLESLIVHQAFAHVRSNQVHGAALLGISRNVMRTLLKRHGLLTYQYQGHGNDEDDAQSFESALQTG
jgi:DNA-binding NtrC family response regulator